MEEQGKELTLSKSSTNNTIAMFNELKQVEDFADNVIKSKLFPTFDEKEKVIMQILVGNELGMSPMQALMYGKKLDNSSFAKINKGRGLGFDIATSLEKIYSFERSGNIVMGTGVDVINALLIRNHVTYTIDADYAPMYKFYDVNDLKRRAEKPDTKVKEYDHYEVTAPNSCYQIITSTNDTIESGKIAVQRGAIYSRYTQITFTRRFKDGESQVIPMKLSLLDAQRAGWYGIEANGTITGGRDNWNTMPSIMLRNRVISIGGRLIIPDVLAGMYDITEIADTHKLAVEVTEDGTATIVDSVLKE